MEVNIAPIHISYRCAPSAGDDTPGNKTICPGVIRDMVTGGYACPIPRLNIP